MTESAFYFGQRELPCKEMLQTADDLLFATFPSQFVTNTSVTSEIPHLMCDETLFRKNNAAPGKRSMPLRNEKPLKFRQSILQKFMRPGQILFDNFGGIEATVKAYLLENGYENFIGNDIDSDCNQQMKPSLGTVLVAQVLSPDSDIEKNKSVRQVAKELLSQWQLVIHKMWKDVCMLNYGLRPIQNFPVHLTQFSSKHLYDAELYQKDNHLFCS